MNLNSSKAFYLFIIMASLAVLTYCGYYFLGGFEEINVYKLQPINRTIAGKYFSASQYNSSAYDHGVYCRELLEKGHMEGELTEVYYLNDSIPDMEVGKFIGISMATDMAEIPQGFEIREYQSNARFAVFMSMHVLVRPRPHKIESMLFAKAQEEGMQLENYFFNIIYSDNSASVEGWAR